MCRYEHWSVIGYSELFRMAKNVGVMSLKYLPRKWKRSILKRIAKRPNFFFNTADLSGLDVLLDGEWEPNLISSIRKLINENGDATCFVDIGANIGLTSIPICNEVARLVAVEPNPISCLILRANLGLTSERNCYTIIEKAIYSSSGYQPLVTPRGNLGGAFIRSPDQSLTEAELDQKEGGGLIIETSTLVPTLSADTLFYEIISDSKNKDIDTAIIKIDVEGLESSIIKALLRSQLWQEWRVALFFESWSKTGVIEIMTLANTHLYSRETKSAQWVMCNQTKVYPNVTEFFLSNYDAIPSAEC